MTKIKKATRVLVICPDSSTVEGTLPILNQLSKLFVKRKLVVVYPGREKENIPSRFQFPITYLNLDRQNYWGLIHSQTIKSLSKTRFDILLDLDPTFRLLNIYLCRLLAPAIRICFTKPYYHHFYNLNYVYRTDTPYSDQLEGLYRFLQNTMG